jgi:hypothetical protein
MIDLFAEFDRACSAWNGTDFDVLDERDRVLIAIWGLEAEVNNGGFDQYYFNLAGDQAWFAPDALRRIGASQVAAIVNEANAQFGSDGPSRDRSARQDQLGRLTAARVDLFHSLDRRFYEYPDDIAALLAAFLERSPSKLSSDN